MVGAFFWSILRKGGTADGGKQNQAKHHVNVKLDMDEMDLTAAESKATYEEIKKYVAEHNDGMKVSNLYIAQIKQKHGIIERENL